MFTQEPAYLDYMHGFLTNQTKLTDDESDSDWPLMERYFV